jgi:5'-deoxynucleotidase YfbR-like HD superfamily hydrolase
MTIYTVTDGPIYVQLASGNLVDIRNLKPEDININDIATSLANTCMAGGHVKKYYSNAQHSLLVSYQVQHMQSLDKQDLLREQMRGLLHDAAETYTMDIRTPLKRMPEMQGLMALEKQIEQVIAERFGLGSICSPAVKEADRYVRAQEMRDFMAAPTYELPENDIRVTQKQFSFNIKALEPKAAKEEFLKRFRFLKERGV